MSQFFQQLVLNARPRSNVPLANLARFPRDLGTLYCPILRYSSYHQVHRSGTAAVIFFPSSTHP